MITANLRVNQLSSEAFRWYLDYLDAIDRRDLDAYAARLSPHCAMQFNNYPPVASRDAIVGMLRQSWRDFASLEHDLLNVYGTDSNFMLEALNHYVRNDGKTVSVRAVALTDRGEDGLVVSVRIYSDVSPLFA